VEKPCSAVQQTVFEPLYLAPLLGHWQVAQSEGGAKWSRPSLTSEQQGQRLTFDITKRQVG
jgi:hypothetical protein